MEFRKMVTITLYATQQKRHWRIEQSFGLCGRGRGWDDLGEWHWNMYSIIYETSRQFRFNAGYWMLGAGALGRPRGMVQGERREEGSGWGTRVYLWQIHVDIWQNQYNIVKLKKKMLSEKCQSTGFSCQALWVDSFRDLPLCGALKLLQPRLPQKQCRWNFKAHPHADRATKLPQSLDTISDGVLKCLWNPDL